MNVTNGSASVQRTFTLDNSAPSVSNLNLNDNARVNSDFGPIEFEVSDSFSGISSLSVSVSDDDGNQVYEDSLDCSGDSCNKEVEFPVSELSSGIDYTLEIFREDSEGNSDTRTVSFTYDDRYEGDTSPEVRPEPGVFDGGGPGEIDVVLEGTDAEDSDVSVVCRSDGWGKIDEAGPEYLSDGDSEEFTCEYTRFEIDRQMDLEVKLMDEAGNTEKVSVGQYFFDYSSPVIGNLSSVVGIYNSDFSVSYDAYDNRELEGLKVSKIHYQVDDNLLDLQEGFNVSEVDGEFLVNTSGLSAGEHTVYAWAVDRVGHVSERESFGFDFRPDAEPSVSLGVDKSLKVAAGDSQTVRVNVSNSGKLFIRSMELQLSSDLANRSRSIDDLRPGDSVEKLFQMDTSSEDLGVHTVELSTESPDSSKKIRLVVEANSDQESKIEQRYEKFSSRYEVLKENISELKKDGLSEDRVEVLEANSSEFLKDFEAARRAYNSGALYEVENHLENISTDFRTASATFEEVREKHQVAERNQTIGLFLLLFVGLGGSGLAYVAFFSEEYYLDLEAVQEELEAFEVPVDRVVEIVDQYELSVEPLENAVARISEILAEEEEEIEEAEEQAFQGFS